MYHHIHEFQIFKLGLFFWPTRYIYVLLNIFCIVLDTRSALQRTCPVCSNLFQAKSELCDRRPLVACVNGDTICADCCNECRKRTDRKCPTCGDNLLPTPVVNKTLMEIIQNCASVLEISATEIEMQKAPFARGGFGKVYNANWRKENVVVKVMEAATDEEIQAVKCEANITLRLNHPNVIKLYGITSVKRKKLGIVMEKAENGSLDVWIGKIDCEKLTTIALGIIDGLKYVHSQKVIHRDIKPKNILMFGPKNDIMPKIADFGVAKIIQTAITTHTRVGQELYMAPEVRMNFQYSFAADIFSLAMMLFEMFSEGNLSQASDEVKAFLLQLQSGKIDRIPESCKVPMHLRNIIVRGWSDNQDERPTLDEYFSTLHG